MWANAGIACNTIPTTTEALLTIADDTYAAKEAEEVAKESTKTVDEAFQEAMEARRKKKAELAMNRQRHTITEEDREAMKRGEFWEQLEKDVNNGLRVPVTQQSEEAAES